MDEILLDKESREKPRIRVPARRDWLTGRPDGWGKIHTCCQHYPNHHWKCHVQAAYAKANGEPT